MVYLWRIPELFPEELIAEYRRSDSPDRFMFTEGVALKGELPIVHFDFNGNARDLATLDSVPNNAQLPLVGPRALSVIEEIAQDDVQVIRAVVHPRGGAQSTEFRLLNVARTVMAIDHKASAFKTIAGTSSILRFRKLVHKPDCLGSHLLARDAEYLSHILVGERLVGRLRELGITGVDFKRSESIKW